MSGLVHRVVRWLPPSWQSAIERESREWRARCPKCLHETSVWELGGVRFKAAGNCTRSIKCAHCSTLFTAPLYRVQPNNDKPLVNALTEKYEADAAQPTAIRKGWGVAQGRGEPAAGSGDEIQSVTITES